MMYVPEVLMVTPPEQKIMVTSEPLQPQGFLGELTGLLIVGGFMYLAMPLLKTLMGGVTQSVQSRMRKK